MFIIKSYRRCFKKCISSSFYQILVSFSRQGVFSSLIIRGIKLYIIALYRITLKWYDKMIHNRQPHFTHTYAYKVYNNKTRLESSFEKPTDTQVLKTVRVIIMIKTKGGTEMENCDNWYFMLTPSREVINCSYRRRMKIVIVIVC